MKLWKLIVVLLAFLLSMMALSAQDANTLQPYDNPESPVDVLASYYNAINLQDYQRAYNYREGITQSYQSFASGFANTLNVQLIIQPPTRIGVAAGSAYADIPAILIADHRDGTQQMFAGCFTTRKSNLQPPAIPEPDVWHIYSANIKRVSNTASIPTLLKEACTPQ